MKTEEGNRLIAEFMGLVFYDDQNQYYDSVNGVFMGLFFKYHTSWDWLMPVVEKLHNMAILYEIKNKLSTYNERWYRCSLTLYKESLPNGKYRVVRDGDTQLNAIWRAVIKFIQWYNKEES